MRKLLGCAALAVSLVSMPYAKADADTVITLASTVPETGVNKVVVDAFEEALAERAPHMQVERFLDGVLGGERELIDLVRLGETDLHMGVLHASQYFPELDPTLVPYLFTDYDSVLRFLDGPGGDAMKQALLERGNAVFLDTYYQGARWATSNTPFRNTGELQGVTIRMPEIPLWIAIWSGLGANTTPIPSPEVFSALQTGVIDAQENMLSNIVGRRIHEVQDYLIATEHQQSYVTVMANNDFWQGLPEEDRTAIAEALTIAVTTGNEAAGAENQRIIAEILDHGLELIEPEEEFFQRAIEVAQDAAEEELADGVYERALEAIQGN